MKLLVFVLFVAVMANHSVSAGKYYKCKDATGAMTFQSKPCPSTNQQTKKTYSQRNASGTSQCKINCDASYQVCLARQDGGVYNSDGGIKLCQNEKQVCHIGCTDPLRAKQLGYTTSSMRADYNQSKMQPGTSSRRINTSKPSNNIQTNQNCTPITRDIARKQAIEYEFSRHARYNNLSKIQKDRVDRKTKKLMSNACNYGSDNQAIEQKWYGRIGHIKTKIENNNLYIDGVVHYSSTGKTNTWHGQYGLIKIKNGKLYIGGDIYYPK